MKKLIFLIFLVACLGSCKRQFDIIGDYVNEEIIYPGRFDTIIARVGVERVELDLLKAGRLPASQIRLGKAKNTVVEYDDVKLVYDSVCSWVNIKNLSQPKMYRFTVYTTDENGNKSVPQKIAVKPYSKSDFEYLLMASPRVTSSPWAIDLKWPQPSSVLLQYIDLTYKYTDRNGDQITGELIEGVLPNIQMENLEPGHDYSIEIWYTVVPKADSEQILDTTVLKNNYVLRTPTADDYQRNLLSRVISENAYSWANGGLTLTWNKVNDDFLQYSIVTYMANGVEKEIEVQNEDNTTVLPNFTLGSTIQVRSNYAVVGVPNTYIDSFDKEFDPFIDLNRGGWSCIYTSVQPATDGYPSGTDASPGAHNAHIDGDNRTMLSMAKPGKSVNGSVNNGTYQMSMIFILDLKDSYTFNYFRVWHRTTDTGDGLRVRALQVYGSNNYQGPVNKYSNPNAESATEDKTQWVSVGGVVAFPVPRTTLSPNMTLPLSNYRYVKVEYKDWDAVNNSASQMSEFYLGLTSSMFQSN